MPRKTKAQEAERQESIARLREWVQPGDTVFTILRHVARSGMARHISVVKFEVRNGNIQPVLMDYHAANALGWRLACNRFNNDDGILVTGCGMDMGFHLVYSLSATLFRNDPRCESPDAGYALNHRWL